VLEDSPAAAALSTADDFCLSKDNIGTSPPLKTEKGRRLRGEMGVLAGGDGAIERGGNPKLSQRDNQCFVNDLVQLAGDKMSDFRPDGNAIGKLAVVQDCAAAAGPTHERATAAGCMLVAVGGRLKISEREGWLLPLVESQRRAARGGCRFEQRFIDGHIPSAGCGRIGENAAEAHNARRDNDERRKSNIEEIQSDETRMTEESFARQFVGYSCFLIERFVTRYSQPSTS
jgi:hypothetical protein